MKSKILYTAVFVLFCYMGAIAQDTIVGWTFPTATKADTFANLGLTINQTCVIKLKSDSAIKIITGSKASPPASAQAMGLSNGTALEKGWSIVFNTQNYDSVKLSSKQNACMMHSGPKYWKIQYKIPTGNWTDVPNGNVIVGRDWTTGVVNNLLLPEDCWDQQFVHVRWIMTCDSNAAGGTNGTPIVTDSSMSRIDDIVITGNYVSSTPESPFLNSAIRVYPNPSTGIINLSEPVDHVVVYNLTGELVFRVNGINGNTVDLLSLEPGVYFLGLEKSGNLNFIKFVIK